MKKTILASGSPRCQRFLRGLDISYEVVLKPVKRTCPAHLQHKQIADYLAKLKATPFEGEISSNCMLLTSDTPMWHEGKTLDKPRDIADAFAMLRSLSGKTHEAITPVCFTINNVRGARHCVTKVILRELTGKEIMHYIERYKPFDGAGAYGIQEWIGRIGVASAEGFCNNVMGLPAHLIC